MTDQGPWWRKGQCIKVTGSATTWKGHTYYQSALGSGGHSRGVRGDEIELRQR
ncbi:hypothetical protein [Streptomyces sp. NPDC048269]|uniref:hypothetical protein n=1 Tax=Streptomyces sp. NPDC048269 TaxID=3155753 RepID=UPI0034393FB4